MTTKRKRIPDEYIKLSVRMPSHPKIVKAGGLAAWLYVCAVAYCREHLTDGVLPREAVAKLTTNPKPYLDAAKLLAVHLFEDHPDGYRVHDYEVWQETREEVVTRKAESKKRKDEWAARNEEGAA